MCADKVGNTIKVIFVDDESTVLEGLRIAYPWRENGFEIVATATNSKHAVNLIEHLKPDLVLIDVVIDKSTGFDVIHALKHSESQPYYIIVSSHDNFEYTREAIKAHVVDYILKPINKIDLEQTIEKAKDLLCIKNDNYNNIFDEASDKDNFEMLLMHIKTNFAEEINLSELSAKFYFNKSYICELFKKKLDMSYTEYLNDVRLRESYKLISEYGYSVTDASRQCGYNNYNYFIKVFKKKYGLTPSHILKGKRKHLR